MGEKKSYLPLDLGVLHFIFYTLLIVYNFSFNPNLNLSPKIDLPQGEMDIKGGIPDFNLDLKKDIKVRKIDASLEAPKLNDIIFHVWI